MKFIQVIANQNLLNEKRKANSDKTSSDPLLIKICSSPKERHPTILLWQVWFLFTNKRYRLEAVYRLGHVNFKFWKMNFCIFYFLNFQNLKKIVIFIEIQNSKIWKSNLKIFETISNSNSNLIWFKRQLKFQFRGNKTLESNFERKIEFWKHCKFLFFQA